jgi:hypothetical protein
MGASVSFRVTKNTVSAKIAALKKRLEKSNKVVKVGFPDSINHMPDGNSVAFIAAVHEYGAPSAGIPERPFLKVSIVKGRPEQIRLNKINLFKIVQGSTDFKTALGQLGVMAQGQVQQYIVDGQFAPLKAATIRKKKSTKPLIDTGQMRQSVMWEIGERE